MIGVGKGKDERPKRYKRKGDALQWVPYEKRIEAELLDSFMYALKVRCGNRKKYSEIRLVKALTGKMGVRFNNCMTAHMRRKIRFQLSTSIGKARLLNEMVDYVRSMPLRHLVDLAEYAKAKKQGLQLPPLRALPIRDFLWLQIVGGELFFRNQSQTTEALYPIFEQVATDIPNLPHHKFINAVQAEADKQRIPVSKSTLQRLYKRYFFK